MRYPILVVIFICVYSAHAHDPLIVHKIVSLHASPIVQRDVSDDILQTDGTMQENRFIMWANDLVDGCIICTQHCCATVIAWLRNKCCARDAIICSELFSMHSEKITAMSSHGNAKVSVITVFPINVQGKVFTDIKQSYR